MLPLLIADGVEAADASVAALMHRRWVSSKLQQSTAQVNYTRSAWGSQIRNLRSDNLQSEQERLAWSPLNTDLIPSQKDPSSYPFGSAVLN